MLNYFSNGPLVSGTSRKESANPGPRLGFIHSITERGAGAILIQDERVDGHDSIVTREDCAARADDGEAGAVSDLAWPRT